MKGREYLHTRNVVFDLRKELLKQKVILTDCYYWKDVYEALRLEKESKRRLSSCSQKDALFPFAGQEYRDNLIKMFDYLEKECKEDTKSEPKKKYPTKAQLMWEVSKEQEEEFRFALDEEVCGINVDELFKLIRGAEYRRGKEDGIKECNQDANSEPNEKGFGRSYGTPEQDAPPKIKELTEEDMKKLPKEVINGLIKSLKDFKAGRYTVSTNDISQEESEVEENKDCLCCKGICDCEYGCDHPHETQEEAPQKYNSDFYEGDELTCKDGTKFILTSREVDIAKCVLDSYKEFLIQNKSVTEGEQ